MVKDVIIRKRLQRGVWRLLGLLVSLSQRIRYLLSRQHIPDLRAEEAVLFRPVEYSVEIEVTTLACMISLVYLAYPIQAYICRKLQYTSQKSRSW